MRAAAMPTILAFGAGWTWNGVYVSAVVRSYRDVAATATAITQTGLWLGGMIGPLMFGLLATATSYTAAWSAAAASLATAAATVLLGRRLVLRARERHA